jgi:hypothetical protein
MAYFNISILAGTEEHSRRYSSTVTGSIHEVTVDNFAASGVHSNQVAISGGNSRWSGDREEACLSITGVGQGKVFSVSLDREAVRWLTQQFAKYERENGIVEDFSGD